MGVIYTVRIQCVIHIVDDMSGLVTCCLYNKATAAWRGVGGGGERVEGLLHWRMSLGDI